MFKSWFHKVVDVIAIIVVILLLPLVLLWLFAIGRFLDDFDLYSGT